MIPDQPLEDDALAPARSARSAASEGSRIRWHRLTYVNPTKDERSLPHERYMCFLCIAELSVYHRIPSLFVWLSHQSVSGWCAVRLLIQHGFAEIGSMVRNMDESGALHRRLRAHLSNSRCHGIQSRISAASHLLASAQSTFLRSACNWGQLARTV